jgi:hypothetical protein
MKRIGKQLFENIQGISNSLFVVAPPLNGEIKKNIPA